jgi:hypothetical protein
MKNNFSNWIEQNNYKLIQNIKNGDSDNNNWIFQ